MSFRERLRRRRYQATQAARHEELRAAYPHALSATDAMALTGKAPRAFYRWLKRWQIRPLVKTAHLTLYSQTALSAALTAPPDELRARREAKQARPTRLPRRTRSC